MKLTLDEHIMAEMYFKKKLEEFMGQRPIYDSRNFITNPDATEEYRNLPYQRGVRLDDVVNGACRPTYMSITVLPKPTFQIGNEKLSLEIGAYYWDEYKDVDLNTPVRGDATAAPNQAYIDVFSPTGASHLAAFGSFAIAAISVGSTLM